MQNNAQGNASTNGIQLVQQIVSPSGEVQHIPVSEIQKSLFEWRVITYDNRAGSLLGCFTITVATA